MADILSEICQAKRAHVAARKKSLPLGDLETRAAAVGPTRGFTAALASARENNAFGLITEIKKASPSRGLIREDFNPASLAEAYQEGGADCLSVLTDAPYFQGHDDFLGAARDVTTLPVLRKDFILDPYQVVESRAIGADCILLIMAALDDAQAAELQATAQEYSLDILVEVHDAAELDRALKLEARLIGINNRNLKTLAVDLAVTEALAPLVPPDRLIVAESGLSSRADLDRMAACGVTCFLVGEALMREKDVENATMKLRHGELAP
ncbi:MAG: indole-3-glycerol phosphate synthase TrpC [Proteobacteria bacterium]|nr:indole-3-glycerol phosphate synthase TrpC [Pseudomonadota bacterium]